MKEILYFNRNKNNRFSIENVTNFIEKEVAKKVPVYSFDVPNITASLHDIIGNIYYVFKHNENTDLRYINYIFQCEKFQKELQEKEEQENLFGFFSN